MAAAIVEEALWSDAQRDLEKESTDAEEIDVDGIRYRRLNQPSSATYFGRWGSHEIVEPLYRQVGVRNGPTVKPLELRVGMIARHLTPDFARIVGELSAHQSSREVEATLRTVGLKPPARAFLESRFKQMADDIAESIETLEDDARAFEEVPVEVASVSAGMDRFSVRMAETVEETDAPRPRPRRSTPYQRKPPPPTEYHWRKAWVGSVTMYDCDGKELQTLRYTADATADPDALADRIAADVEWVMKSKPDIPVRCIQDAAPELSALPEALDRRGIEASEHIDFEHLMGYIDKVVDHVEPDGDPHNMKSWYRGELLRDDLAIDRIWRSLLRWARNLPDVAVETRQAIDAAISYIRERKDKMRYASAYAAKLPIGSGATEATCWAMQRRVKREGQAWGISGIRGTLAVRALVLSDRWPSAWESFAAGHRAEVVGLN